MNRTKNIWTGIFLASFMLFGFISMRFIVTSGEAMNNNQTSDRLQERSFSESLEEMIDD